MKLIVPVNVCIKRFYRTYAEVNENASDEEILETVRSEILTHQGATLDEDPDLFIEQDDIVFADIDHDGAWTEEEDEEITEILNK